MIWKLLWLFLIYSFAGWVLETVLASLKQKKFANRGIINGPFCLIYGFGGIFITAFTGELTGIWLFMGCAIVASVVEWIAGHLIEMWYHERWWDYRKFKWNLDGYISVPTSCIWGLLGVFIIRIGNGLCINLYNLLPGLISRIIVLAVLGLLAVDAIATLTILFGHSKNPEKWIATEKNIDSVTWKLGAKIDDVVNRRITKAYPQKQHTEKEESHPEIFAYGCSFYKIVLLFFIGAFLGDITETIFCRITAGVWMSRSSVVWGDFSIVWGLAIAAVTALLYRYRNRSEQFLFWMGTFLGGAYEYICSVFTEIVFGTVFWDYSDIPFNLGGRINLLYCFFWGFAAVAWFKILYPRVSKLIEKLPIKFGKVITWLLLIFMLADGIVSSAALARYNARSNGVEASNSFESWVDENFDDARMAKVYPKAKKVDTSRIVTEAK
ncbi:putative ABC transporter permease [Blautia sp. HCP3S3_H10_1]|uniref:putative ABC transporter permease n=1 Tax=unclassified Blautia TaxID=2648079 RepID=UPI003F90907A|nr:putative ABC transporter permease [Clostridia bacterium]